MSFSPSDSSRRRLAEAADSLAEFRDAAGLPAPPEAPSSAWRAPAEASVRAALEEAVDRVRRLEGELLEAARERDALVETNRRQAEALDGAAAGAAAAEALRVRAAEAEARAAEQKARASLMEAEYVRLESMRRKAESALADAESSGRVVEEAVRRELRAANAALDRAAAESGAMEGRVRSENEALRLRLESAVRRLQTLEREKRIELARGGGDTQAMAAELQRAQAVAVVLRQELAAAETARAELQGAQAAAAALREDLAASMRKEAAARRELSGTTRALADARAELVERNVELEAVRGNGAVLAAQAAAQALSAKLAEADRTEEDLRGKLASSLQGLDEARAELERRGGELLRENGAALALQTQLQAAQAGAAELSAKLAASERAQDALRGELAQAARARDEAAAQCGKLGAELARASATAAAAKTVLDREQAVAAMIEAERAEAKRKQDALYRDLWVNSRDLEEAKAALAQRGVELELARGSGPLLAAAAELERSQALVASLRGQLAAATVALDDARTELVTRGVELSRGGEAVAAAQAELLSVKAAAADLRGKLAAAERMEEDLRRELQAKPASAAIVPASPPPVPVPAWEEEAVESPSESVALPDFVQPSSEAVLDPGWARLLRLVRPPVDAAYAQLRRLSSTALTAGQKTLLRMAAASIAQATDSLASVELALEDGPAGAAAAAMAPALEAAVAAWEAAFRRQGVALVRDWPAALPDVIYDPKALRVMLNHVLRNVLEAVPRGGKLTIMGRRALDGGVRLEFADDGPGFTKEWLERRFEPFSSPRRGRAGLGLSLVRRTLRRWGGDADAFNATTGRGARVTMLLAPAPPRHA